MFSKIEIVPRWIIFFIDLSLSLFALFLAKLMRYDFDLQAMDYLALYQSVLAVVLVNSLIYRLLKTYSGIIRFTSSEDALHMLGAMISSSFALFLINALVVSLSGHPIISTVSLVIYSLLHYLFLISYRITIKYFFVYVKNMSLHKVRLLVYGAGEAGLATKKAFQQDPGVHKSVVAFIDDDLRKIGKTIDGVKILAAADLETILSRYRIDELVFASYSIPVDRKNEVVDLCLAHHIKVLNIPPHESWNRGAVKSGQIQHIHIEDLLNRQQIEINIDGIQQELKGKTILITGAAGSIGSEIVRQLLKFETGKIIMCDQNETALHHLSLEVEDHAQAVAFIGDVRDEARMDFLFRRFQPNYVYHAAAYKHVPMMEDNPAEAIKTNVLGTKIIAGLAVKYGVSKFVMISTDKAVNPTNIMGASKRIAEIYVQSLNHSVDSGSTRFITTRFGNVLGSNGSVIPRFKQQIQKGGPITVTHPEITRYFMTIPEACRLVLEAGCMGNGGEIFIFDMGKSVKIIDLAKRMIRLAGLVPDQDIKILYTGLRPGEKLYEELLNDAENVLPTHHEKIRVGQVRVYVFSEVQLQVAALLKQAGINDNLQLVMQMKAMVPEYKSKNSRFEALDYTSV